MMKIITISGMIGSGKTTFIKNYADYLEEIYGIPVMRFLEPVDSNELLTLMYEDPKRWTYTSQVRFLVDKLNTLNQIKDSSHHGIFLVERDYKEHKIFIEAQLSAGSISQIEYESYMELYTACESFIPPVLNYHIEIPFELSLERMRIRGRSCEALGSEEYYRILYNTYANTYKDHPAEYKIGASLDIETYRKLDEFTFKGVYD